MGFGLQQSLQHSPLSFMTGNAAKLPQNLVILGWQL
jgi:hypothetical protein